MPSPAEEDLDDIAETKVAAADPRLTMRKLVRPCTLLVGKIIFSSFYYYLIHDQKHQLRS